MVIKVRNSEITRTDDSLILFYQIPGTGRSSSFLKQILNTQNRWLLKESKKTAPTPLDRCQKQERTHSGYQGGS
jgi:hypothetical protein